MKTRNILTAAAAVPTALLLAHSPSAHACCGDPEPPTPGEQKFIANVHGEGFQGVDAESYPGGVLTNGVPVMLGGRWSGMSQRDANILEAGQSICGALGLGPFSA